MQNENEKDKSNLCRNEAYFKKIGGMSSKHEKIKWIMEKGVDISDLYSRNIHYGGEYGSMCSEE